MFIFLLSIYILVSLLLILIVLLQVGQGAEMGAAFGSATQGQVPHTPENFLGKVTTYVAILFMLLSIALVYVGLKDNSASVLDSLPVDSSLPLDSSPSSDSSPSDTAPLDAAPSDEGTPKNSE